MLTFGNCGKGRTGETSSWGKGFQREGDWHLFDELSCYQQARDLVIFMSLFKQNKKERGTQTIFSFLRVRLKGTWGLKWIPMWKAWDSEPRTKIKIKSEAHGGPSCYVLEVCRASKVQASIDSWTWNRHSSRARQRMREEISSKYKFSETLQIVGLHRNETLGQVLSDVKAEECLQFQAAFTLSFYQDPNSGEMDGK